MIEIIFNDNSKFFLSDNISILNYVRNIYQNFNSPKYLVVKKYIFINVKN